MTEFGRRNLKKNNKTSFLKKLVLLVLLVFLIIILSNYLKKSNIEVKDITINKELSNENKNNIPKEHTIDKNKTLTGEIVPNIKQNQLIIKNNIPNKYDFKSDLSITKYVSPEIHFNKLDFHPNELKPIDSVYITNSKKSMLLRKESLDNLYLLAKDFYKDFNVKLVIFSSFRDYKYQKWIKDWWCPDNLCAKAWYSEHQTWLAVDIFDASTKDEFLSNKNYNRYYEWMKINAYKYWFHNSYQNWIEIDWYNIEPWHWRYLWTNLAKILQEKNLTFSQYYKTIK